MPHAAHEAYLETQVLTATPQKLRLMLIDGAMRFARQALEFWDDSERRPQRCAALARCNDILTELFMSIRADGTPVAQTVQEVYRFLLLQLAEISQRDDADTLREVLEILEIERETWQQLCEQMPEPPAGHGAAPNAAEEITAAGMPAIEPQASAAPLHAGSVGHLSLEA